jgi:cell fate regulator YaaT (PSP1 superfamily)
MEQQQQPPYVVGVRFSVVGKIYHFDARKISDLMVGDSVIVETSRGWQLGQVAQLVKDPPPPPDGSWKSVDRKATPRDLLLRQSWANRELEVVITCRARSKELHLVGVKIVAAEFSFDGTRLAIMFSTETEDKADLKSLRSEMQKMYAPSQVEMRQIGPRDVAKILGGMGACGLENRCCSQFLTDFSSISIRMAKEQGISLTPTEITGMCGRLRCCLIYEYEQYVAARAQLPKRNKRVITPQGEGKVVDVLVLKEAVMVEIPEVGVKEFLKDEIKPAEEYENFQKKAQSPCDGPGGEGCDCGRHGTSPKAEAPSDPDTDSGEKPALPPKSERKPRGEHRDRGASDQK